MNALLRALALTAALLISAPALAGEAVPVNATFGIKWTPLDWSNWEDLVTSSMGAARLPNGKVLTIEAVDRLDTVQGRITSDMVIITFSDTDWVYAKYENIQAVPGPTASFFGPMEVIGGEGRFAGATGTLSLHTTIFFSPVPVGVFDIKGVIKTAK